LEKRRDSELSDAAVHTKPANATAELQKHFSDSVMNSSHSAF
jgi:hypothetical protein